MPSNYIKLRDDAAEKASLSRPGGCVFRSEKQKKLALFKEGADWSRKQTLEEIAPVIPALELILDNWPSSRDGMDWEIIPSGVKSCREQLKRLKEMIGENK